MEREARDWLEGEGWAERCDRRFREVTEQGEIPFTVFCSALLQALDAYHKDRCTQVERSIVELPGGSRTAFLSSPKAPIAGLVPKNLEVPRTIGEQENDLRAILKLWWHLVDLEDLPVQPRFHLLRASVSEELGRRLGKGDLLVALASPFARLAYEASGDPARRHPDNGRIPYRFTRLASGSLEAARSALDQIFALCARRGWTSSASQSSPSTRISWPMFNSCSRPVTPLFIQPSSWPEASMSTPVIPRSGG
jgi:hypothetical protein